MTTQSLRLPLLSAVLLCSFAGGSLRAQATAPPLPSVLRGKEVRDSIYHAAMAGRIGQLEAKVAEERDARIVAERAREQADLELLQGRQSNQRSLAFAAALLAALIGIAFYWKRTEQSRSERQWGLTDPLTGAKNRRYLEQTIVADMAVCARRHARAAQRSERAEDSDLVFLMFDLDHFKDVNDQHGHMVGDEVLRQIVKSLEGVCRQSDVICRWGGEEFLVVGRFTDRALAPAHAERIRSRIESCVVQMEGRTPLQVTCSVGYASYPFRVGEAGTENWHQIVALADQATYIAKRNGRNRCAGLIAGAQGIGTAAVTPEMVKLWIAQDALMLEEDAGKSTVVASR